MRSFARIIAAVSSPREAWVLAGKLAKLIDLTDFQAELQIFAVSKQV